MVSQTLASPPPPRTDPSHPEEGHRPWVETSSSWEWTASIPSTSGTPNIGCSTASWTSTTRSSRRLKVLRGPFDDQGTERLWRISTITRRHPCPECLTRTIRIHVIRSFNTRVNSISIASASAICFSISMLIMSCIFTFCFSFFNKLYPRFLMRIKWDLKISSGIIGVQGLSFLRYGLG